MPLVTISAAEHAAEETLLRAVADAVADALGLGDGDVIALATPVRSMVASGRDGAAGPWPIATIHGSDRGEQPMRAALAAAEQAMLDWGRDQRDEIEGVWVEWALPLSR